MEEYCLAVQGNIALAGDFTLLTMRNENGVLKGGKVYVFHRGEEDEGDRNFYEFRIYFDEDWPPLNVGEFFVVHVNQWNAPRVTIELDQINGVMLKPAGFGHGISYVKLNSKPKGFHVYKKAPKFGRENLDVTTATDHRGTPDMSGNLSDSSARSDVWHEGCHDFDTCITVFKYLSPEGNHAVVKFYGTIASGRDLGTCVQDGDRTICNPVLSVRSPLNTKFFSSVDATLKNGTKHSIKGQSDGWPADISNPITTIRNNPQT